MDQAKQPLPAPVEAGSPPSDNGRRPGWLPPVADLVVKVLAIAVPMAYVLGREFIVSYWARIQLPSGIGAYDFHDYVYYGFSSLFVPLLEFVANNGHGRIGEAIAAASAIVVAAFVWLAVGRLIESPTTRWGKKLEARVRKPSNRVVKDLVHAFFAGFAFLMLTLVFMFLVLLMVFPLAAAKRSGEGQADQLRQRLVEQPERYAQATWTEGGISRTGRAAFCTERWCVLFVDGVFQARSRDDVQLLSHVNGAVAAEPAEGG